LARLTLTRPRLLGIGLAAVSLAFAACSKSGSSPTPTPTVTALPTASASPNALASPCALSLGIAYEPDAGSSASFHGVQVTHFEDNAQNLCGAPSPAPVGIAFSSAVGAVAFASDLSDAIAVLQSGGGGYTLAQDIFGASLGQIVPVGQPYDLNAYPTPIPTASPAATPTPPNATLLNDASSLAVLGSGSGAVALAVGPNTQALVALTSLTNAPPQYGQSVPFSGSTYTLKSIPSLPRSIVRVFSDSTGKIVALVRGPQDLLSFKVTVVGTGYQFDAQADDTTLGSNATLRGNGAIAPDPLDASRALVGGTTAGGGNVLTLVTGLPSAITKTSSLALPGNIRSIAVGASGSYAVVGTDVGIVVVNGVGGSSLSLVPPFGPTTASSLATALAYANCNGAASNLTNVSSVGLSADARYLVALGTANGVSCPSGANASIVAVPFNSTTGAPPTPGPTVSPSPGATATPSTFVQNNVIAPPLGADYLIVH
jgi:hypothetical protein